MRLFLSNANPLSVTVESVWHPQCPFALEASISPDFTSLSITYITRNATPKSLVDFGQGAANSKRKCYATVNLAVKYETPTRFYVPHIDVQGSARVDKGLVATIETSLAFEGSRSEVGLSTSQSLLPRNDD